MNAKPKTRVELILAIQCINDEFSPIYARGMNISELKEYLAQLEQVYGHVQLCPNKSHYILNNEHHCVYCKYGKN